VAMKLKKLKLILVEVIMKHTRNHRASRFIGKVFCFDLGIEIEDSDDPAKPNQLPTADVLICDVCGKQKVVQKNK